MSLDKWSVEKVREDAEFIYEAGMNLMSFLMSYSLLPITPPLRPRGHKLKKARSTRGQTE